MRLAVPKEIVPGEKRVALVPEVVPQLLKSGHTVTVESGAGLRAGFTDEAYTTAGAIVAPDASSTYANAEMLLKVQRPTTSSGGELDSIGRETVLIGLLQPAAD